MVREAELYYIPKRVDEVDPRVCVFVCVSPLGSHSSPTLLKVAESPPSVQCDSFNGSIDHDGWWQKQLQKAFAHSVAHHSPTLEPNNKGIYEQPWSLLALFPRETTGSSCIDFQECPQKPGAPVGGKPLVHAALHMFL